MPAITPATTRDLVRQVLNVVAAVGQPVATAIVIATGAGAITDEGDSTTRLVPANFAFAIWGLIYAGGLVYAFYQARPSRRADPLLRRIGWATAIAFAGTALWLFTAQRSWLWPTVLVFFGILAALLVALVAFIRERAPRSIGERLCVVAPISVYAGWATVATVANVSTALAGSGFTGFGIPEAAWAVALLLVAGGIATFVTRVSRGNVPYALTVVWALVGIAIANLMGDPSLPVALVALVASLAVVVALRRGGPAAAMQNG